MNRDNGFVLLTFLNLSLRAAAGDGVPRTEVKVEMKYAPMPWHLVDTWWDISQETPFESLALDVTISDDVPY